MLRICLCVKRGGDMVHEDTKACQVACCLHHMCESVLCEDYTRRFCREWCTGLASEAELQGSHKSSRLFKA